MSDTTKEIRRGLEHLSRMLGEELAKGVEYDSRVGEVLSALAGADEVALADSRRLLPELWVALDGLVGHEKRAAGYY